MTTSIAFMDGYSQAKSREHMTYTDQHGREFSAWGDVKAKLHPTGPLMPNGIELSDGSKLFAPWYPNQGYAKFGTKNPTLFTWDYDAMLADARLAHQRYQDLKFDAASHFNVPNFDPDKDEPTAQMARDIGPAPLPYDPIRGAKQENGYILGLRPFDARRQADVKLAAALERFVAKTHRDEGEEFADTEEFADEPTVESIELPRKRGPGRPKKEPALTGQE